MNRTFQYVEFYTSQQYPVPIAQAYDGEPFESLAVCWNGRPVN